jgi:hypothetical protein
MFYLYFLARTKTRKKYPLLFILNRNRYHYHEKSDCPVYLKEYKKVKGDKMNKANISLHITIQKK